MRANVSIVIPVYERAWLTERCVSALLRDDAAATCEIVVVDDASTDSTRAVLGRFAGQVRTVARDVNGGFAAASNAGAAVAKGEYLLFLNNDVVPEPGWLDALIRYAGGRPQAAVVGSKLLFPDGTVQHAGVAVGQDGLPRHLYAGFPADHPAVNRSRRMQIVTAACMLVSHEAFDAVGGFDEVFRNDYEDVDLCLRIGELGFEVHYCHESVLHHLEGASRARCSADTLHNLRVYRERWGDVVERDDLRYYLEDGLLRLGYGDLYPVRLDVSPLLAVVDHQERGSEVEELLLDRARQVSGLLREVVRLSLLAEVETKVASAGAALPEAAGEDLEDLVFELQRRLGLGNGHPDADIAGPSLAYRRLARRVREVTSAAVPEDATVLVASRGDDQLLRLGPRIARHFPEGEAGGYAGHYPPDDRAAIDHLEELRAQGADYLVLPATAFWWLERYPRFGKHVSARYPEVVHDDETCAIYALGGRDD